MKYKKIKLYYILFFSAFVLMAFEKPYQKELKIYCESDTLIIDDTSLKSKTIMCYAIKEIEDTIYCYLIMAENNNLYCFKYIDFKWKQQFICPLTDDYKITSKWKYVSSIDVIDKNRLLLFQENRVSIFNFYSKKIEYSHIISENDSIVYKDNFAVIWDKYEKKILLNILRFDNRKESKNDFDTELGGLLNPINDSLTILPLKYPPIYQTSLKHSYFSYTNLMSTDNFIIGTSAITPDLVVFNKRNLNLSNISIKHPHQTSIEPIDIRKIEDLEYMLNHASKNILYRQLYYDSINKIFFRIYLTEATKADYTIDLKLKYNFGSKFFGIIVMDDHFNVIGDFVLTENKLINNWAATSKGLMVLKYGEKGSNAIIVKRFKFKQ